MTAPILSISRRTRSTPYSPRVEAAGVKGYTVYNHMLLPTFFESVEADAAHLKTHVQVWDVAVERQVEIKGPDAAKLVQFMTPRDLSKAQIDQCLYIPLVDEKGGMLNDPVAIKLAEDRFWISVADSDVLLYAKGLANGGGYDVEIDEPDINIIATQGPKSEDLMVRVFGERVRDIKFFRGIWLPFEGTEMLVARSGYSKQGGHEIYVPGGDIALRVWDALFEAGQDLEVRAGCPNLIERIEGGLLSYGNDMTRENTPYECGLGKFCATASEIACVGREALIREATDGPKQMIRGLKIGGDRVPACRNPWPLHDADGNPAGQVTSAVWSPFKNTNIAIGMVVRDHWEPGTVLHVAAPDGTRDATVCTLPFSD